MDKLKISNYGPKKNLLYIVIDDNNKCEYKFMVHDRQNS